MLQIRVSVPSFDSGVAFTDPIVLEMADEISLVKTVNSSDESITFSLPVNDPKLPLINYLRWWECWDTITNQKLNYGPFNTTTRTSGDKKVFTGPGRSAVLLDFYASTQTFYERIDQFFDDIRYENIAGEPRTSTIIAKNTDSDYYGLSKRSKDFAIDEQTGFISMGRDNPDRGTIKTDLFWAGTGRADYLTVDLGEEYTISKAKLLLPWWGGATINNNRVYDYSFDYSDDNSAFTTSYQTPTPNYARTSPPDGKTLYFCPSGSVGFEYDQSNPIQNEIPARYWKLNIENTHAYYGNIFIGSPSDEWAWECGESNVFLGESKESPTISGGIISKSELTPSNDCYASAVEIGLYRKIIDRDTITGLSYRQIDGSSRQITYYHVPDGSEMIGAGSHVKFEPGSFFRNVTYTGGSGEIKDEYNVPLDDGTTGIISCPAYTRLLLFGAGAQVDFVDTWPATVDAFSFGGSYQYSTIANDTTTLHFRGVSVKWYATVPLNHPITHAAIVPGAVSIQIRAKSTVDGSWGSYTVLESSFTVPANVSAKKIWEITPESGILQDNTVYELLITKLDANFVSIDAFAGFWSGSMSTMNQDDARIKLRNPQELSQHYSGRYSFGSAYEFQDTNEKVNTGAPQVKAGLRFYGDRAIVYSIRGKNYGQLKIGLFGESGIIPIPGGDPDGGLTYDLNYNYNIAQAIIFDSNDFFKDPNNGLPWGNYVVEIYRIDDPSSRPIWLEGIDVHEAGGISAKFINQTKLDILKSTAQAVQMEWDVTENGIKVVPRLGVDTNIIYAEGRGGASVVITDVEDISQIASMLISSGADIDGLPLTAVVEDKDTRRTFGRTIQRLFDLRNTQDYFMLLGASRTELRKRKRPQKRITVNTSTLELTYGDSFIAKTPELEVRARAMTITRNQSSSGGTAYQVEAVEWPLID